MAIHTPLWLQKANEEDPDIEYPASEFRQLIADVFKEGILTGGAVSERGAGANFTVDVAVFRCVIDGDDGTDQGSYLVWSDAVENITVSAAPGSDSRIDLVVIEVNDEQAGGTGSVPFGRARVIAGTPSGSPSAPAVPDTAIGIATIGPITPATTSIEDSLITDIRGFAELRHNVVGTDALVDDAVTTAKIAAAAVTATELASDAVTTAKIDAGAVTATELASSAVTTAKILDANVTEAKLASAVLSSSPTAVTYQSGFGAHPTATGLQYKKIGNMVFVWGGFRRTSGSGEIIAILPAGFRPADSIFAMTISETPKGMAVTTGGNITIDAPVTNTSYNTMLFFAVA